MRPLKTALIIAGAFLGVSLAYIMASDWLVHELVSGPEQVRSAQSFKGTIYVVVVAIGLFGLTGGLLRRIQSQMQELQTEREALLGAERRTLTGTLAASIAHDVNNLVGVIKANLDWARQHEKLDPTIRDGLEDAREALEELVTLNDRLRTEARQQTGEEKRDVDLSSVVEGAVAMIHTHSRLDERRLDVDVDHFVQARAYPDLVTHALINLVLNAADATDEGGRIRIAVRIKDETIELAVEDDGPGIAGDRREEVLEPFVTSKEAGTGLGLFSVAYCADQHSGSLEIGDSELGGAKVTLRFPAELEGKRTSAHRASRPSLAHDVERVTSR